MPECHESKKWEKNTCFFDELSPFLVVYWKICEFQLITLKFSAFSGVKITGHYIFQLLKSLEVTGHYLHFSASGSVKNNGSIHFSAFQYNLELLGNLRWQAASGPRASTTQIKQKQIKLKFWITEENYSINNLTIQISSPIQYVGW